MQTRGEESKQTSLMSVICTGTFKEIKSAIGTVGDVNETVSNHKTILSYVIQRADSDPRWIAIFKLLLQAGAKPHTGNEHYWPYKDFNAAFEIVGLTCTNPQTKNNLMKCLLTHSKYPVDLNMRREVYHDGILSKLCYSYTKDQQQQNLPVIKTLLDPRYQVNINDRGVNDQLSSPLFNAAHNGFIDAIDLLLEKNADLESTYYQYGHTPALEAAKEKQYEALKFLLDRGAKTFSQSSSLLHIAVGNYGNCDFTLFQIAMEYKTPLEMREKTHKNTPLLQSSMNAEMTIQLLKLGADAKATHYWWEKPAGNFLHSTLFHLPPNEFAKVIEAVDIKTLKFLLEMQNDNGNPPLHHGISMLTSAVGSKIDNIKILVQAHRKAGVPIDIRNARGFPPLFTAVHQFNRDALMILIKEGCNIYETITPEKQLLKDEREAKISSSSAPIGLLDFAKHSFSYTLIEQELQNPTHPDNQKRLKCAFLMGLQPRLGANSEIFKISKNANLFDKQSFREVFDFLFFKKKIKPERGTSSQAHLSKSNSKKNTLQ